ncbi:MAG: divalent metal cation transporter [bacterium]|nr:divalent metal cation transporter [bacterium]
MGARGVRRLAAVLFWSIIAAAFIGPGTVTSAASAGAGFGYSLLWTLLFSTVACLVLQEASGRLTVVSGRNLGEALRERYPTGWQGGAVLVLVLGAVVLGCAAYEAGNILGGVAGAVLTLSWSPRSLALGTVAVAAVLLFFNSPRRVAFLLSLLVGTMGVAFLWTSTRLAPPWAEILGGALWPSLPEGASLLAIALVGTTVVPYNLFLGSGLARGQTLPELRFGLSVAVVFGGLISMGVLVVGAAVQGSFSFEALADVLVERLGPWGRGLFGVGLFAAGLSSAVTAPLAAAMTARSVLGGDRDVRWIDTSWRFRAVWGGVLTVGLIFGVSGIRAVPVIIVAQALNGVLLPVVALFLLVTVNDRGLLGRAANRGGSNIVMGLVTLVTLLLGTAGVLRAGARALGQPPPGQGLIVLSALAVALVAAVPVSRALRR